MIISRRPLGTALVGAVALLTLAACGASSAAGGSSGGSGGSGNGGGYAAGGSGGQRAGFPGVSGLIVARTGNTVQVRTASGQSAVSFTGTTTITEQRSAAVGDVKAGLCATVRSTEAAGGGSGSSASPAAPAGGPITAASVALSEKVDGSCSGGFGARRASGTGAGGMPSGAPGGAPPSGAPSAGAPSGGAPSGAPGDGRRGFGGATGTVTAVDGSTLTLQEDRGGQTSTVTVALTSSTTYSRQVKASASAVTTGRCVLATGKADSTGAMAATALRLSAPVDGACGFGGGRRPGAGQSGG